MKIIAHRGASAERPENSMAAFERALEIGVDAIEADLLVSRDGRLVARHDDLIQKDGAWYYANELTFDELQEIDIGDGERIPSLEMVFERFYGRCTIVLDLKQYGMAELLTTFLKKRKVEHGVHVTSFLHSEIAEIGRLCPAVERSIALAAVPITFQVFFQDTKTHEVSLFRGYLNETITQRLRGMGIGVRAYPVNLLREAEVFAAWGIDAIFTDDPAAMQSLQNRSDG
jgi:glycerophosphoryl diester phosphodiesterase